SRIKSMAIVHELLYKSDTFSEINIREYLGKLGNHLQASLSNINSVTVLDSEADTALNINLAVPLGLLLYELAFYLCAEITENESTMDLYLQMIKAGDVFCLKISSPQSGLPKPFINENNSTLRMNLIKTLLTQTEGDMIFPSSDTLLIEIKFKTTLKKGSSSTLV
ncbi:MAG: histidine kinase dimerization/phosphoacceptor domain -containing protein, partial [Balneolaceae bacterium]